MTIAAVIFDVDGTLVDSNDAHARAWVGAFAAEGVTVAFDVVRRAIGMGGDKLMPEVADIEDESALGKRISEHRARLFRTEELPGLKAFDAVRPLAERMKADGYLLTVASSAKQDELDPLLECADIADLVSEQASSDDADNSKPDPDIVLAALRAAKADPAQSIMLGDTPYDVAAATKAGVRIVALECGGWSADELKDAAAVYTDAADLLANYSSSPFARQRQASKSSAA